MNKLDDIMYKLDGNKKDLDQIKKAMDFLSSKYDDVVIKTQSNEKEINSLREENNLMKGELLSLKSTVRILETERVKNKVVIKGCKEQILPNTLQSVIEIGQKIKVPLSIQNVINTNVIKTYM
ncbi:TMF1.2 family protein [Megaselia abdita]